MTLAVDLLAELAIDARERRPLLLVLAGDSVDLVTFHQKETGARMVWSLNAIK